MTVTMQEVTPIGLCIVTQDMMDSKRYRSNFGDNLILRARDRSFELKLTPIKRELNSYMSEKKYLEGFKIVIISNIDKIMALVSARYSNIDLNLVDSIVFNGKVVIEKILNAESFDKIAELDGLFKTKITLPVYDLFIRQMKKGKTQMI